MKEENFIHTSNPRGNYAQLRKNNQEGMTKNLVKDVDRWTPKMDDRWTHKIDNGFNNSSNKCFTDFNVTYQKTLESNDEQINEVHDDDQFDIDQYLLRENLLHSDQKNNETSEKEGLESYSFPKNDITEKGMVKNQNSNINLTIGNHIVPLNRKVRVNKSSKIILNNCKNSQVEMSHITHNGPKTDTEGTLKFKTLKTEKIEKKIEAPKKFATIKTNKTSEKFQDLSKKYMSTSIENSRKEVITYDNLAIIKNNLNFLNSQDINTQNESKRSEKISEKGYQKNFKIKNSNDPSFESNIQNYIEKRKTVNKQTDRYFESLSLNKSLMITLDDFFAMRRPRKYFMLRKLDSIEKLITDCDEEKEKLNFLLEKLIIVSNYARDYSEVKSKRQIEISRSTKPENLDFGLIENNLKEKDIDLSRFENSVNIYGENKNEQYFCKRGTDKNISDSSNNLESNKPNNQENSIHRTSIDKINQFSTSNLDKKKLYATITSNEVKEKGNDKFGLKQDFERQMHRLQGQLENTKPLNKDFENIFKVKSLEAFPDETQVFNHRIMENYQENNCKSNVTEDNLKLKPLDIIKKPPRFIDVEPSYQNDFDKACSLFRKMQPVSPKLPNANLKTQNKNNVFMDRSQKSSQSSLHARTRSEQVKEAIKSNTQTSDLRFADPNKLELFQNDPNSHLTPKKQTNITVFSNKKGITSEKRAIVSNRFFNQNEYIN